MFLRPFSDKFRTSRWTMWFASCCQALQIWLCFGCITGNFGGHVDQMQLYQLSSFQKFFFLDPEIVFSTEFEKIARGTSLGKLSQSHYTPSPIQETLIPFLILTAAITASALSQTMPQNKPVIKALREGATYAFMVPLMLASTACITSVLVSRMRQIFGIISFFFSILLILYFFLDFLTTATSKAVPISELITAGQEQIKEAFQSRINYKDVNTYPDGTVCVEVDYRSFDVDQASTLASEKVPIARNYWEYLFNLITPLILVLLIYAHIIPTVLITILYVVAALLHSRQDI